MTERPEVKTYDLAKVGGRTLPSPSQPPSAVDEARLADQKRPTQFVYKGRSFSID